METTNKVQDETGDLEKAKKIAINKKFLIEIIDKGILDMKRASLFAAFIAMDDQDGKCGCRDVCGCKAGCLCTVSRPQEQIM